MKVIYLFLLTISLQAYHISSSKNETNGFENIIEELADDAQKDKPVEQVKVVEEIAADLGANNTKPNEYVQVIKGITDDLNNIKNESESNKRKKRQLIGVHIFERPKEGVKKARGGGVRHGGGYGQNSQKRGSGHDGPVVHHGGGYGRDDHHGGGYGHDDHDGGGYGHNDHHDGSYSNPHGVGYGHDDHHDVGYGQEAQGYGHGGYKEPPKKIKPAPYYGPQYSPYDLVAPDKSKKGKVKYGDDPVNESKKGSYHKNSYDKPLKHFGGFGGGGSIGYNAGSLKGHKGGGGYGGYGDSKGHAGGHGGGHKGHGGGYGGHKGHGGGYGGGHKGHGGGFGKGHGGGYGKGPKKGHGKGHGGGYGKGHGGGYGHGHKSEPLIGGYSAEEVYQHQGGAYTDNNHGGGYTNNNHGSVYTDNNHGGGYTNNNHGAVYTDNNHGSAYTDNNHGVFAKGLKIFEGDINKVKHVDYLPVPIYTPLSSPYNTYDAHANFRVTKGSNADVSHMLLSDPYTRPKAKIESRAKSSNSKT